MPSGCTSMTGPAAQVPMHPVTSTLTESVKVMLAATASRAQGGKTVALADLTDDMPSYDGRVFWEGYGAAAGKLYAP